MVTKQSIAILVLTGVLLSACSSVATPTANVTPDDASTVLPANTPKQMNTLRTLSVTGEGKAEGAPDIAVVNLGVETRDPSVAKSVSENNAKATSIDKAILGLGVDAKDIQTTGFSVYFQPLFDDKGQTTGQGTYIVGNTISVTVRNLANLGQILGGALDAGANSVSGVTFTVADPTALISTARGLAIADARAKANEIAKGLKVSVGRVLTVAEGNIVPPIISPYAASQNSFGKGGGPVPVESGTYTVTMQLSVVFEIK